MNTIEDSLGIYCRICATQSNQIQSLFDNIHNGVSLAEMLMHCLKRPVSKTDGFPIKICTYCKTNLISSYAFVNLCETSERLFLNRFLWNERNDDFKPFSQTSDGSQTNEVIDTRKEIENKYGLAQINVDENIDFEVKSEEPELLVSELVCVEENFDVNSILMEENSESIQAKNRSPTKRRKCRQQVEERFFECYECKRSYGQFHELRQHMNDHDKTQKPFECTTCKLRFVHLNSWLRHRPRHTENIHECEYCSESFKSLPTLKRHIQESHKGQLKSYKCMQCSKEFALRFLLLCHNEWHKKAKEFVCSSCDAVFFNKRKLNAHVRDNHASKFIKILFFSTHLERICFMFVHSRSSLCRMWKIL